MGKNNKVNRKRKKSKNKRKVFYIKAQENKEEKENERFFGHNREFKFDFFDKREEEESMVCMCKRVDSEGKAEIKSLGYNGFDLDDWMISTGDCSGVKIFGPFKLLDDAFYFGKEEFGVVKWISPPVYHGM